MVLISSGSTPNAGSFSSNKMSWGTLSNADFRSLSTVVSFSLVLEAVISADLAFMTSLYLRIFNLQSRLRVIYILARFW